MEEKTELEGKIVYPSIVFKVKNQLYCMDSKDITTILQLPSHEQIPNSPRCITGMFSYRNDVYQMLDLRSVFHIPTLEQENNEFSQMIEMRKQDHIQWVEELERCMDAGEEFTLATDPHKCAFGHWYDRFETENHSVRLVLGKIEEPHRRLHEAAVEVSQCTQQCDSCTRSECLKSIMRRVEEQYMPTILNLLDETKEIFKSNIYREMVLIMNHADRVGIVVDEVLSVEELEPIANDHGNFSRNQNSCLVGVQKSPKFSQVILEIDAERLLQEATM